MEPIPQTLEAIAELDAVVDDETLLDDLLTVAAGARAIAPHCVGISVALQAHGVTFTLVATSEEVAALDAVQYLTTGPCVEALEDGHGIAATAEDLLEESRWQAFARATAAAGVRSTLTFPVVEAGRAVGTVNLYGGSDDAFGGRHDALAAVVGAWAPGAVTNADLSFSTRDVAEQAPARLRDQARVDVATGILATMAGVDVTRAEELMVDAAQRAGVPLPTLAEAIISLRAW